ncbi:MAG: helix-turn-helix domain-containing protein [Patescibacteria group bacterium]|jgi:cytoskeletal protein RodZ
MAFIRKQIDVDRSFGDDLKELRELRGWSHEHLAKATGIPASTIRFLELEDFDSFRDPVYAERHVRVIVKTLEGRVGFFVHKFHAALEQKGFSVERKPLSFFERVKHSALFVPSKYFLLLLPLPFVILLGWYVWRQAAYLSTPPILQVTSPTDHMEISEPTVLVSGITDPTASVTVNGQAAVVESSGVFDVTLSVPRGMSKLDIVAERRYGKNAQATRYITYAPSFGPGVLDASQIETEATSTATSTAL